MDDLEKLPLPDEARLPRVYGEFIWCGERFRRLRGDVENGFFPVLYMRTGKLGLMAVADWEDFSFFDSSGEEVSDEPEAKPE